MTQAKAVSRTTATPSSPTWKRWTTATTKPLLLDASGFVSEGAGENLFIVKNGVVYTPRLVRRRA